LPSTAHPRSPGCAARGEFLPIAAGGEPVAGAFDECRRGCGPITRCSRPVLVAGVGRFCSSREKSLNIGFPAAARSCMPPGRQARRRPAQLGSRIFAPFGFRPAAASMLHRQPSTRVAGPSAPLERPCFTGKRPRSPTGFLAGDAPAGFRSAPIDRSPALSNWLPPFHRRRIGRRLRRPEENSAAEFCQGRLLPD